MSFILCLLNNDIISNTQNHYGNGKSSSYDSNKFDIIENR